MNDDFLADFNLGSNTNDGDTLSDSKETQKLQKISGGELEKFARSILDQLIADNIPPIPANFKIYFQKMLDDKNMTFRKKVLDMMEFEETQDGKQAFIENKVKKSSESLNHLLHDIAMIYKNTEKMQNVLLNKIEDLSVNSSNLSVKNVLGALQIDVNRYTDLLEKYSFSVKKEFEEISHIYKTIEEQSDFDQIYGVYNHKFLFKVLNLSKEGYAKYNYQNSLLLFQVKKSVMDIISKKDGIILLRSISKIVSKSIAKGDVVAHYKDGIFAVLFQHTNLSKAGKITENLIEKIYNTNFFMSGNEIEINLQAVLTLVKDEDLEKMLAAMIKSFDKTGKDKEERFSIIG